MPTPIFEDVAAARQGVLRRAPLDELRVPQAVLDSIARLFGAALTPAQAVERIISDVRVRGDAALQEWGARLDGATELLEVPQAEIERAAAEADPTLLDALRLAAGELERFHRRQVRSSWVDFGPDGALGQLVVPLRRVGVYVPGGSAALPSSLLHAAIPARVAGVAEIIVCSPPQRATGRIAAAVLAAAHVAGVERVFAVGGAQAVAAMAYGTASVPQVDTICGPGSLFVVLAKRAVYGVVGIESLPGPTETMVIADDSADARLVAADMLAQAEHALASAILLTPSPSLARAAQAELARQLEALPEPNAGDAAEALAHRSGIVVTPNLEAAFALANEYAPEHLCLLLADPWQYVGRVRNAGGIFLGERSFEVLGDYTAGPSHIMPTGGTARFASPLNVENFRKVISLVGLNEAALQRIGPPAVTLAEAEGLAGHAAAVRARLEARN
jgi:histidinol dehydrogenase